MEFVSLCLVTVAFCLALVLGLVGAKRRRLNELPPPLETGYNPVLGHLLFLAKNALTSESVVTGFVDACKASRHPIVSVYPGPPFLVKPIIMVLDPKEGRHVLAKGMVSSQLQSAIKLAAGGWTIGSLPVHHARKHIRIIGNALLRPHKIDHCCGIMRKHLLEMFQNGEFEQDGGVFDEHREEFDILVQKVLFENVLGVDVSENSTSETGRLFKVFRGHFTAWLAVFVSVLVWPFPLWTFSVFNPMKFWKLKQSVYSMREEWLMPIVLKRETDISNGVEVGQDGLSTMMVALQDTSSDSPHKASLVFENKVTLCNELMGMLLAGDTTSGNFLWIVYHLANRQDIQDRIYDEVVSVIGTEPDLTRPNLADMKSMPYLAAFLSEVNRLTPVSRSIIRNMPEEQRVAGYVVPTGVEVHTLYTLSQLSDNYYDNANEFRPQRWLDNPSGASKEGDHGLIYAPFGYGSRRCFGQVLAKAILKVAVTLIVQSYCIEALELSSIDSPTLSGMVEIPTKMRVRFVRRHGKQNKSFSTACPEQDIHCQPIQK